MRQNIAHFLYSNFLGRTSKKKHPVSKNANFVTNALGCDLSTDEAHYTCSVHQWIGNLILPKFDLSKSSLALLESEILPYCRHQAKKDVLKNKPAAQAAGADTSRCM